MRHARPQLLPRHLRPRNKAARRWSNSLLTLYRSIPIRDLQLLRDAFELDAGNAETPVTRAFCAGRIQAIDQVLSEKGA